MRRIYTYGPAIVVVLIGVITLVVGPRAIRQLQHAQQVELVHNARAALSVDVDVLERINAAHRHIASVVEPSVVFISTQGRDSDGDPIFATGSGWVYDAAGHIITNFHVVQDARRIQVQFSSGWVADAELVGEDELTDIAVLRVSAGPVIAARRATGRSVQQGDQVFAFGSPFNFKGSVSLGIVSGTGRTTGSREKYQNYIQTDAAINKGNSGGPLTNIYGEVVGMNTAIATLANGVSTGVGFAIPLQTIESIVEQILVTGVVSRTVMGVNLWEISQLEALKEIQSLGFTGRGVLASYVFPGYPADQAGLQNGDIITHVDGEPMSSVDVLRSTITGRRPGDAIVLRVWRKFEDPQPGGETLELTVILTQVAQDDEGQPAIVYREPGDDSEQSAVRTALLYYGIERMADHPSSADETDTPDMPGGVMVVQTERLSRATRDGIYEGRIITAVNGEQVLDVASLLSAIADNQDGQGGLLPVEFTLWSPPNQERDVQLRLNWIAPDGP